MASPSLKNNKPRTKPPTGRPAATSGLAHPAVQGATVLTTLSAFSPGGNYFALVSLAVDKHCLRVYDTAIGQSVAEHFVDIARVSALAWAYFDPSDASIQPSEERDTSAVSKKRKKRASNATVPPLHSGSMQVVMLGLSDGTVSLYSPSHGRIVRTFLHSSCTSEILSLAITESDDSCPTLWTSSTDGVVRSWNPRKNQLTGSWKDSSNHIPYSCLAVRPGSSGRHILVANHGIRLLSMEGDSSRVSDLQKPRELAFFTGHASSLKQLEWDASTGTPQNGDAFACTRFLSTAQADRVINVWDLPELVGPLSSEGRVVASIPLDSDVRHMSLCPSVVLKAPQTKSQTLLTLSTSGQITVYPIPSDLTPPTSTKKTKHKIPTLLPRSNIRVTPKKTSANCEVIAASFVAKEGHRICIAMLMGGVRPVFDTVEYVDAAGDYIQDISIIPKDAFSDSISRSKAIDNAKSTRYAESSSLSVHSGVELGQEASMDELGLRDVDGELDVDLAEMSLGQRLAAQESSNNFTGLSASESEEEAGPSTKSSKSKDYPGLVSIPVSSLSRTLIQALHSSDTRLLELCLAHNDQELIRNTVRKLPPQLAVPLLLACMERLGRGSRGVNLKGGGGGASAQRGTGLIVWVKTVLAVHSGHLLTIPDLVARLSGLHATLNSRLALQERLLSLSGRLDLVISQIELRSSVPPAPVVSRKKRESLTTKREPRRYVEGESTGEDEDEAIKVEIEEEDDTGSIENIELGVNDEEDDEEEDDSNGNDDDDDDENDESSNSSGVEGRRENGFIDDEAAESEEEEEDEEEE